jgi:hypothetical protein
MIWQIVLRRGYYTTRYNRSGEGGIEHFLACGHSIHAKQSCGTPARKRCRECEREKLTAPQSSVSSTLMGRGQQLQQHDA